MAMFYNTFEATVIQNDPKNDVKIPHDFTKFQKGNTQKPILDPILQISQCPKGQSYEELGVREINFWEDVWLGHRLLHSGQELS